MRLANATICPAKCDDLINMSWRCQMHSPKYNFYSLKSTQKYGIASNVSVRPKSKTWTWKCITSCIITSVAADGWCQNDCLQFYVCAAWWWNVALGATPVHVSWIWMPQWTLFILNFCTCHSYIKKIIRSYFYVFREIWFLCVNEIWLTPT